MLNDVVKMIAIVRFIVADYCKWLNGQVKQGAQGTDALTGWGIWHVLCIKEHFFINSRGELKPEQGGLSPLASRHFYH